MEKSNFTLKHFNYFVLNNLSIFSELALKIDYALKKILCFIWVFLLFQLSEIVYLLQFEYPNPEKESIMLVKTRINNGRRTPLQREPIEPINIKAKSTLFAN